LDDESLGVSRQALLARGSREAGVYDLKFAPKIGELAKDVAAFSNTLYGGLIVIGIGTRVDGSRRGTREADGTHWLPRAEVRRLLAAGWLQAGGPGWTRRFQPAHDQLIRREAVGRPATGVYRDGPGVVQVFEPAERDPGWVLAHWRTGFRSLSESIWRALHDVNRPVFRPRISACKRA
jgi:hypothetical protein